MHMITTLIQILLRLMINIDSCSNLTFFYIFIYPLYLSMAWDCSYSAPERVATRPTPFSRALYVKFLLTGSSQPEGKLAQLQYLRQQPSRCSCCGNLLSCLSAPQPHHSLAVSEPSPSWSQACSP